MRFAEGVWTRRLIAASAVALAGCSLFVSLDDLQDGDAGGAVVDAALDVTTEATLSDASGKDGGSDDAAFVCTGFCDGFDDRTTLLGAWDNLFLTGSGDAATASIASDVFVSAPHAAHFHLPARASGAYDTVNINKTFPLTGKVSVDADMKIVGAMPGFTGFANLLELTVDGNYAGSVTVGGGGNVVLDYWVNYPDGGHIQPLFGVGAGGPIDSGWHHIHYDVVYDQVNGSVHATWDGAAIIGLDNVQTFGSSAAPTRYSVSIGSTDRPNLPVMDVYFDNVQVQ